MRLLLVEDDPMIGEAVRDGRLMWAAICTALWPLTVLTAFVTLWKRSRVRVPRERDRR